MRYEWKLPDVGEGIHEAEIIRWFVREQDQVEVDQVVAEIQTDKALVEIPCPVKGVVTKINAAEGEVVRVGTVVLEFEVEAAQKEPVPAKTGTESVPSASSSLLASGQIGMVAKPLATPAIRRLARELAVNLQEVKGSGADGRITEDDVRSFANRRSEKTPQPTERQPLPSVDGLERAIQVQREPKRSASAVAAVAPMDEERIPIRGLRRAISEQMVRSKFTAPHVTGMDEADVTELVKLRRTASELAAKTGATLTYLPFIIKAVVSALKAFPYFNASVDDERGEFVLKRYYNIGIAVDTPDGLVVPVVHHADQKSILELAAEISRLTEKAHKRTLGLDDMQGGTFTISNIGSFGGLFATPVINHPEVAILATGRIARKPVALDDDTVVVRQMMPISVTFDHRIIDGGTSGRFTRHVMEHLQNPIKQFLEMR